MKTTILPIAILCLLFGPPSDQAREASASLELARQLNQAFIEVAEKVSPAVVVISVVQKPAAPAPDQEEGDVPAEPSPREFRRYFHRQFEDEPPESSFGQGSGVIVRPDGYILTNGHVVEDAEKIEVRLRDGRSFKAKVRGVDPKSDVAVIKIEAKGLPVATLADSTKTRVGEFAIAIGAPFSLDYSVTYGHVSAKGRSNVLQGSAAVSMDQDFIQTDANINPGNSGGPLVNINGEVIGINTLIRGLHTGIGFAIPSSLVKEISDQLIAEGKFTRAWLGIGIRALRDDQDLRGLIKSVDDGVVVSSILPNGPAFKSDLRPSDVITAVDGNHVSTAQDLRGEIRGKKIGQPVTLDVFRSDHAGEGKMIKVKVKPAEWVEAPAAVAHARRSPGAESELTGLGLTVHVLTPELAKQFGVEITEGVIVLEVRRATPAASKEIKPGDIITSLNHQPTANPKQFREAVKKADLKKGVVINLLSGKTARFEILKEDGE
jgi:serine protease Do